MSLPEYLGLLAALFTAVSLAIPDDPTPVTQAKIATGPDRNARSRASFALALILGFAAAVLAIVQSAT